MFKTSVQKQYPICDQMAKHDTLHMTKKADKPYSWGCTYLCSPYIMGDDNSNKRCFGTKPKLFREFGDFSRNRDTWKISRETRDNSGALQKKLGH